MEQSYPIAKAALKAFADRLSVASKGSIISLATFRDLADLISQMRLSQDKIATIQETLQAAVGEGRAHKGFENIVLHAFIEQFPYDYDPDNGLSIAALALLGGPYKLGKAAKGALEQVASNQQSFRENPQRSFEKIDPDLKNRSADDPLIARWLIARDAYDHRATFHRRLEFVMKARERAYTNRRYGS